MSWIAYYVELTMQQHEDELRRRLVERQRWRPEPKPRRWTWSGWLPPRPGAALTRRRARRTRRAGGTLPGRPAAA